MKIPFINRLRSVHPREKLREVRSGKRYKKVVTTVEKRPFFSFFVTLGLLFGVIILASVISSLGRKETPKHEIVKSVATYTIGTSPTVQVQAVVEKTGVVEVVALTPGIVQQINVNAGDTVYKGTTLVSLSSNYQGGNTASLSRQLAATQYKNVTGTYDEQKDVIKKQREIAEKSDANTEELRKISENSLGDTKDLLSLNETLLTNITDQITTAEGLGQDTFQLKQLKAQIQAGTIQLKGSVRSIEYQSASDKPANQLTDLGKDIALKQLEIQEKALDLGRDVSRIQLQIAQVNEAMYYPASPYTGKVQRVHVKIGQSVNPGTPLFTVSCDNQQATAVVNVPFAVAQAASTLEPSRIHLGDTEISLMPAFVSQDATDGQLYSIIYNLPEGSVQKVTDKSYVLVDLPAGLVATTTNTIPYIPVDAVYQTQENAYVYVVEQGVVKIRTVRIGSLYGKYVEIASGLKKSDKVVLNRNVIAGDKVKVTN
ncbi:MAG TPA: HlyD family efflux transporter periplasmic adaptor subunit [Patescibacteria group bacterium]|nr:HlyD family efflux transporter periplasmic adaptor subunit [Patescibacteria group bacterium]